MDRVSIELYKHKWKFEKTRNSVGTRAKGECFHSFSTLFNQSACMLSWDCFLNVKFLLHILVVVKNDFSGDKLILKYYYCFEVIESLSTVCKRCEVVFFLFGLQTILISFVKRL